MKEEIEDALLIAYLHENELPDEQKRSIALWLQEPENKAKAIELYNAWEISSVAGKESDNLSVEWEKLEGIIDARQSRTREPKKKWQMGIAASIILALGSLAVFLFWSANKSLPVVKLAATDGVQEFSLPDHSMVTLDQGANLTYRVNKLNSESANRIVKLHGNAYFDVEADNEGAFIIHTSDAEVKVTGTKFYVSTNEKEGTSVSLIEGSVVVRYFESNKSFVLNENEKIESELDKVTKVPTNDLFWKTRTLDFMNTPLTEVFKELSRRYGVKFSIENNAIGECQLTSQFRDLELSRIIEILQSIYSIRFVKEDHIYIVSGDGCE